jgi:hypothetical protein
MNFKLRGQIVLTLLLFSFAAAIAAPTKPDYSAFSIIPERNIFNTKRSPAYKASARPPTRPRPTESLALTGTMRDEKGPLAFFDGSHDEYRRVLKPNDSVAGFQIVEIEHAYVKLKNGTNEVMLPVNMQLAREEQGEWQLGQRSETRSGGEVAQVSTSSSRSSSEGDSGSRREGGDRRDRSRERRSERSSGQPADVIVREASPGEITNAPPSPAPGGDADILEILRRRREQENN